MVYTVMHVTDYKELTTDVTGQKVAGHETGKVLALAIQHSHPPVCTEGEPLLLRADLTFS